MQRRETQRRRTIGAVAGVILMLAGGTGYLAWIKRGQDQEIFVHRDFHDRVEQIARRYRPPGGAAAAGPDRILETLTALAEGSGTNPDYAKALDLLEAGKPKEAEALLRPAAEKMATDAKSRNKEASEAFRRLADIAGFSDPKRAREDYARAVDLDPDNVPALLALGELDIDYGELDPGGTARCAACWC